MLRTSGLRGMHLRLSAVGALTGALLALITASSASAQSTTPVTIGITGLPSGQTMVLAFDGGVSGIGAGNAVATSGSIKAVVFASNAFLLTAATPGASVAARAVDNVFLSGGPVTGTATIPAGTTVTMTVGSGPTVHVASGHFSFGASVIGTRPAKHSTVRCRGTRSRCRAVIGIAGRTNRRQVTVRLPSPGLRPRSLTATPANLLGSISLSQGHYTDHRRRWIATVSSPAAPPQARITLTFAR